MKFILIHIIAVLLSVGVLRAQSIVNGGFESNFSSWNAGATWYIFTSSAQAKEGSKYAFFGVASDGSTPIHNNNDSFSQSFPVPSNIASLTLRFWYRISSDDTSGIEHDTLVVSVIDQTNHNLAILGSYSNINASTAWAEAVLPLPQSFAGQTIGINFKGTTNGSLKSVFRIDQVSLSATTVVVNPPFIQTNQPTNVTSSSATLNGWTAPNGLPVTALFEYGTSPSYGLETTPLANITASTFFNAQLTNLQPNTTYYYKAVAIAGGIRFPSAEGAAFTTPPPPPVTITSVSAANVTDYVAASNSRQWVDFYGSNFVYNSGFQARLTFPGNLADFNTSSQNFQSVDSTHFRLNILTGTSATSWPEPWNVQVTSSGQTSNVYPFYVEPLPASFFAEGALTSFRQPRLGWTREGIVLSYDILRDNQLIAAAIPAAAGQSDFYYTDASSLVVGQTYSYVVVARNHVGTLSSSAVLLTIPAQNAPVVTIISPSGNDRYPPGSIIPIQWSVSGNVASLSRFRISIYTGTPDSQNATEFDWHVSESWISEYAWRVPTTFTAANAFVKITALDSQNQPLSHASVPFSATPQLADLVALFSCSKSSPLPLNTAITFDAGISRGPITSYHWRFSDGKIYHTQTVTRVFPAGTRGTLTVELWLNQMTGKPHASYPFTFPDPDSGHSIDPTNTATGAFISSLTAMKIPARGLPFSIQGFYNSQDFRPASPDGPASLPGSLGYNWSHTFEARLYFGANDATQTVSALFGDGHAEKYERQADSSWTAQSGVYSRFSENTDGSYSILLTSQISYRFDSTGLLRCLEDRSGNQLELVYEDVVGSSPPAKRIQHIRLPGGPADGSAERRVTFHYRSPSDTFLWKLVNAENHTVLFDQDANGDLVGITDENGHRTTYTYDALHQIVTGTNARGHRFVKNQYDDHRRVVIQWDSDDHITHFDYTGWPAEGVPGDRVTKVIRLADPAFADNNPLNELTEDTHNKDLQLTKRVIWTQDPAHQGSLVAIQRSWRWDETTHDFLGDTDPKGQSSSNEWLNGNLTKSTARDGGITTYLYEDPTNPTLPTLITFPNGKKEKRAYFARGKLKDSIFPYDPVHPDESKTSFAYDAFGQPFSKTDKNGNTTYTHFDEWGYLWKTTDALGHDATFEFNKIGQTRFYTNRRGLRTEFVLDSKGQTLDTIIPNPEDAAHPIILHNHYDENDNLDLTVDGEGNETHTAYDNQDRPTRRALADDSFTETRYDVFGYAVEQVNEFGGVTHIARDLGGRVTDITPPAPANVTTHFENDLNGNVTATIRPSGFKTEAVFDEIDRQVETWRYKSATELEKTKTHFNTMGQQEWADNERGERTSFAYDDSGFHFETTPITGPKLTFEKDAEGHTTKVTDARGNFRRDKFTKRYELETQTDNLGNVEQFFQNEEGSLNRTINADGQETILERNLLEQLTQINPPTGPPVRFKYNNASFRTRMEDVTGLTNWTPNSLGLVAQKTQAGGLTLDFTYYPGGREKTVTLPGGKTATYYYDTAGRFDHMTDWAGHTWAQFYDAFGRPDYLLCPNGVKVKSGYDSEDRLSGITIQAGDDPPLRVLGYVFDSRGLPEVVTDSAELSPTAEPLTRSYEVSSNRLATAGGQSVPHDNRGNVLSAVIRPGSTMADTFSWDFASRLVSGTNADGAYTNSFDGLGNRVATTRGGSTTRFVIDDRYAMPRIMAEADAAWNVTRSYLYIGNVLVGCILPDGTLFCYHSDRQGNIVLVTDGTGSIAAHYYYDSYGQVIAASGSFVASNHFRYLGGLGVWDNLDGTLHARARTYCPALQRFLSQDALLGNTQDGLSLNRYVYAGCSPHAFVDPSGLSPQTAFRPLVYNTTNANSTPAFGNSPPSAFNKEFKEYWLGVKAGATWSISYKDIPADSNMISYSIGAAGGLVASIGTEIVTVSANAIERGATRIALSSGTRQTLIHFTDDAGRAGIMESGELWASTGSKNARFGDGQYFTDITPEMIGASTKAGLTTEQIAAGQISAGQVSSKLFGIPWNSAKMSHFIEIDVTGLNLINPRPGTFLLPNSAPLDLTGRIIRSGALR